MPIRQFTRSFHSDVPFRGMREREIPWDLGTDIRLALDCYETASGEREMCITFWVRSPMQEHGWEPAWHGSLHGALGDPRNGPCTEN